MCGHEHCLNFMSLNPMHLDFGCQATFPFPLLRACPCVGRICMDFSVDAETFSLQGALFFPLLMLIGCCQS